MHSKKNRLQSLKGIAWIFSLLISISGMAQTISDKHEVQTQITINTTAEKAWKVLTDFEKYPEWHPYISKIEGNLKKKSKIKVTYKKNDHEDGVFSAYIIENEENKKLSWGGSLGFIFRAKHYYMIEPIGIDSIKFTQGEYWKGIFGGMYGKKIYEDTTRKFELMNCKLKEMLEN